MSAIAVLAEPVVDVADPPNPVTDVTRRLRRLESDIRSAEQLNFKNIGNALAEIKRDKLYRKKYGTFEDYCEQRWGYSRQQAYNYIHAAEVLKNVHTFGQNTITFGQAIEFARVPPEHQGALLREIEAKEQLSWDGKDLSGLSVRDVRRMVDKFLGKPPKPEPQSWPAHAEPVTEPAPSPAEPTSQPTNTEPESQSVMPQPEPTPDPEPHAEKRKNRNEAVDDFEEVRAVAIKMLNVGLREMRKTEANHSLLDSAKTWALYRLTDESGTAA